MPVAVIGLSGGLLYAVKPNWNYGSAIDDIVMTAAIGRPVNLDAATLFLIAAALAGGVTATLIRGDFALRRPDAGQIAAALCGGALMGLGGALIPGGNDGLVLYTLPGFLLHGLVAYAAMNAAIALALVLRMHIAPMEDPPPDEQ